jgi:polyferredoxin
VLWSGIGVGLTVLLFVRSDIDMTVAPVRNPQYVTLSDGSIRNTYDVRIRNMTHETSDFRVTLGEGAPFIIELEGSGDGTVEVPIDSTLLQRVYVTAPAGTDAATVDRTEFRLWIEDLTTNSRSFQDTTFVGREPE